MTPALLLLAALAAAPAKPSAAAATAKRMPVQVDAQEVRYDYPKREVTFTGSPTVKLTRGDAVLTCRRLVANNDAAGRISSALCTGDVRFVRGERNVTCDRALFDNQAGRVTCEGTPVVLNDGATEAKGTRLVYELDSDQVTLEKAHIEVPGEDLDDRQRELEQRRKAKEGGR